MYQPVTKRPLPVWLIIILLVVLALGALPSAILMILAPDGRLMHMPVSMLQHSPFHNFLIPGLILGIFNGIYPLLAAWSLWKRPAWRWPDVINPCKSKHWSWAASWAAGVIVMIWIAVQVLMVREIVFLHILYFGWGVVIVLLTLLPNVQNYCYRNR